MTASDTLHTRGDTRPELTSSARARRRRCAAEAHHRGATSADRAARAARAVVDHGDQSVTHQRCDHPSATLRVVGQRDHPSHVVERHVTDRKRGHQPSTELAIRPLEACLATARARRPNRRVGGLARIAAPRTPLGDRTRLTRRTTSTYRRAEVHQRLVVLPRSTRRNRRIGQRLRLASRQPPPRHPREHPCDVGVDHAGVDLERKYLHRSRRVGTDARQRQQGVEARRQRAGKSLDHLTGREMQIPCPPRIPQPRPLDQHVRQTGRRERRRRRPTFEEPEPPGNHAINLGLLQHHLGHEDRERVAGSTPRQVTAHDVAPAQQRIEGRSRGIDHGPDRTRSAVAPAALGALRDRRVTSRTMSDLTAAETVIASASAVVDAAIGRLADIGLDDHQVLAYDVAHAKAALQTAQSMLGYGAKGELEERLTHAFVADAVADLAGKVFGREADWGVGAHALDSTREYVARFRDAAFLAPLATTEGPRHLGDDFEMVQDTFRRFADEKLKPIAEHIHRHNADIPEAIITGLAEMGAFGLSIAEEYGGFASGTDADYIAMVVATEELSRGSLGAGGSLITRPEILARALEAGGTEEQKQQWLPLLATAEVMNAVAVTEPDYGSDVAGVKVTATPSTVDGIDGYVINGVKTWCTFGARADVLMLLARTDPDRNAGHRGLSMFIVPKLRGEGHGFDIRQADMEGPGAGKMEGRAIDTIGYRGMHSYEVAIEDWFVPAENLIGLDGGKGRGFYYQMAGFENGRLQTAARAIGVMQAAYEAARDYAENRKVFGANISEYQLTQVKLARMAVLIQAARQFAYEVARMMARGEGALEASLIKAYVCKAAEWVTREAMQIHGGMGYAEEYDVSRYYVDARVLSIFEGADETLCIKVIARQLVGRVGK